jgi:hypothetical protein
MSTPFRVQMHANTINVDIGVCLFGNHRGVIAAR